MAALIGRIDRRGRMLWSLPKGHIEQGETAEQTAIREVAEETGIQGKVLAALGSIDYWFVTEGRRVHKTVHHYLMRFSAGNCPTRTSRSARWPGFRCTSCRPGWPTPTNAASPRSPANSSGNCRPTDLARCLRYRVPRPGGVRRLIRTPATTVPTGPHPGTDERLRAGAVTTGRRWLSVAPRAAAVISMIAAFLLPGASAGDGR